MAAYVGVAERPVQGRVAVGLMKSPVARFRYRAGRQQSMKVFNMAAGALITQSKPAHSLRRGNAD